MSKLKEMQAAIEALAAEVAAYRELCRNESGKFSKKGPAYLYRLGVDATPMAIEAVEQARERIKDELQRRIDWEQKCRGDSIPTPPPPPPFPPIKTILRGG